MTSNAIEFDVIKIHDKSSKEGRVFSIVAPLPDDKAAIDAFTSAYIGSKWRVKFIPLDDDGNPESEVMENSRRGNSSSLPDDKTPPASADPSPKTVPVRAPIAPDKRMTQRAAILCKDPVFQTWLRETNTSWRIMMGTDEEKAALLVQVYCGVKSRKEIIPGSAAAELWDQMVSKFYAWRDAPEMADA
jgi:hypothetical protein